MTKKLTPTVEIELDKKRPMVLDLNAIYTFEKYAGIPFFQSYLARTKEDIEGKTPQEIGKMTKISEVHAMVYACLNAADDDFEFSFKDVGKLIDLSNLVYAQQKTYDLVIESQRMEGKEAKGEGKNENRSTG